jgi:hypothetical protein
MALLQMDAVLANFGAAKTKKISLPRARVAKKLAALLGRLVNLPKTRQAQV